MAGTSSVPTSSGAALQKCTQVLLLGSYTRCQKKLNSASSMRSRWPSGICKQRDRGDGGWCKLVTYSTNAKDAQGTAVQV